MIPSSLYKEITNSMPIVSVEAIIMKGNSLLFLKRRNIPARGEWWFPGGRIRIGESFEAALYREVIEETGLAVEIVRFVGVYNRIFPDRHDITIAFLCKSKNDKVVLNDEHSEYRFFENIPDGLHVYMIETIKDLGW